MTHHQLTQLLANPAQVEPDQLNELMQLSQQYPYASPLHTLILLALHKSGDLRFAAQLQQRAPYIPNLSRLYLMLKEHPSALLPQKKEAQEQESASDIISSFLEEYPDEDNTLDLLLQPTTPATKTQKGSTEEQEIEPVEDLIANFLSKGEGAEQLAPPPPTPPAPTATTAEPEEYTSEELFTETLARIYIRQGKYQRAKRILQQVNLEFSKKSGYFAEQIDFLDKLIRNSKQEE